MTQPVPDLTPGFPDLFIYALTAQLKTSLSTAPDFPALNYFNRPLRPTDPNFSVAVFEADVEPVEYEIGSLMNSSNGSPSMLRWNAGIQVIIKAGEEQEGRALRAKLLNRVRSTLFSNACASALMTLNDLNSGERVTKYRLRRIAFASGDLAEGKAKFFIGQVEIYWDTEFH